MARYPQTGTHRFRTIMGRCRRGSRTRGTGHAPGLGDWADPRQLHGCWAYPRKLPGVPDIPQTIAWGMRGNPSNYLGAVRTTRFGTKRSNDTQPRARQSAPARDTHGWHDGRIAARTEQVVLGSKFGSGVWCRMLMGPKLLVPSKKPPTQGYPRSCTI